MPVGGSGGRSRTMIALRCVWACLVLAGGTGGEGGRGGGEWSLEGVTRLALEGLREAQVTAAILLGGALLLFVWHCHRVGAGGPSPPAPGTGPAPARSPPQRGPGPRLYGRLQAYAKRYSWAGMGRVHRALREPGPRRAADPPPSIQRPALFFLPEVPSTPYFPRDAQRHDVEVLERHSRQIMAECERARRELPARWDAQNGGGGWLTFHLYRRGVCQPANCRACPGTFRAIAALRTFINSNTFGDACFSLLAPGTLLTGSYGPTNVRLRCHLGLKIPAGCELVVGGEPQCWSEGYCLLVDDSFLNTTAHNGPPDSGPRVIFIVDLWHPNIAAAERQALDYIFAPGQ